MLVGIGQSEQPHLNHHAGRKNGRDRCTCQGFPKQVHSAKGRIRFQFKFRSGLEVLPDSDEATDDEKKHYHLKNPYAHGAPNCGVKDERNEADHDKHQRNPLPWTLCVPEQQQLRAGAERTKEKDGQKHAAHD